MAKHTSYQQPIFVTENKGTINISDNRGRPPKPPLQSKTDPKSIRFEHDTWEKLERAARAERMTNTDLINLTAEAGIYFSADQIRTLIRLHHVIAPLLDEYAQR